ncbi:ERCC4 domain protein [Aspergillus sclerotialis]|uniref:ERCC4 domain protein n=1 Tax=Aspergillus sclerotialis TaxID=2070753 RepID=A0A3A2Z3U2_9EURO|nr:ERCC4 domain protein [Aspergillus sclerotialis]
MSGMEMSRRNNQLLSFASSLSRGQKMPDVIDLISSTPPHPPNSHQQRPVTAATPFSSSFPASPNVFTSDGINDSLFDLDDLDKPAKRRRVSNEPDTQNPATTAQSTKDVFLFSDEDLNLPPPAGPSRAKTPPRWNCEESDPIVFTSSAPDLPRNHSIQKQKPGYSRTESITIDDDDDIGNSRVRKDDIEEFSDQIQLPDVDGLVDSTEEVSRKANSGFSSRTANLLASLESRSKGDDVRGSGLKTGKRSRKDKDILSDELEEPERPKPVKKTSKLSAEEKEARAREREAAKAQREREKQLEKERKQKLKEEKAREKQLAADISEVNKLKVDKKDSTPEMIVDLASSLEGSSAGNQTMEFMKRLGVECTFFQSDISNIVRWRRKVVAKFNESAGYWEPCPLHICQEEHVLCLLTAQEFVDMVITTDSNETDTLEMHIAKIKSAYPNSKPIYLIEGLMAWMRKNKNSRNRAYQAEVLRQMRPVPETTTSTRQPRKKSNKPESTPPVDDDTIEDALLNLQVAHSCLIHHTNAPAESAEWIKNFTEHVSTIPYRRERMEGNDSAFCMDVGQVKTGEDKSDTFVKMLQEVNRVTASMAYGIVSKYPSVTDLIRGMKVHGPTMLEDVRKSANKNGALTDSRIGPAASKRLYKVFMGMDPTSTDI